MTWIIAGAVFFLLFLFLGIPVVTDTTGLMTGMLPAVLILLASAIGFMAVGIRQRRKITRRKAVQYQLGAADAAIFTHITGLPLADGAECNVLLGNGEYIFERMGTQIHLPFVKVRDVACKTETEIQNSYVSSIGGAMGGAYLFGPIGAMIGGRAKKKTDVKTTKYFMIAYDKGGEIAYLAFDCQKAGGKGEKFANAFLNQKSDLPQHLTL